MGYCNIYHIAPAVLHMNPGITREEYLSLLDKTHGSWYWHFGDSSKDIPLTYFDEERDDDNFHSMKGLASLLRLSISEEYNTFVKTKLDEHGIPIESTYYYPEVSGKDTFTIYVHEKNEVGDKKKVGFEGSRKIKAGCITNLEGILDEESTSVIVKEIHTKKFNGLTDKPDGDGKESVYKYKATIIPFKKIVRKEIYACEEDMLKNWPIFSADNKYAWSSNKGNFDERGNILQGFEWCMKDGKYYLDESSFDKMSATSYSQLILSEEAIKVKVWKPFSYKGGIWFGQFLNEFPNSRARYEKAVWDAQTCISAKLQGMTYFELLRYRLCPV